MLDIFGSKKGVEEPDSLRNRDFSIISYKASISSLCLAYAKAMTVAIAEITALEIEFYIMGSIVGEAVISLKQETIVGNLFTSMSQERL